MRHFLVSLVVAPNRHTSAPLFKALGLILLALFVVMFGLYQTQKLQAQGEHTQNLSIIRNGAAQFSTTPILLDDGDNALVDVEPSSNGQCLFLAYIDRDDGNRLFIRQRAGDKLIDVPLPTTSRQALASFARDQPGFAAPGEKQADGSIAIRGGVFTLLFTSRAVGDPNGKFHLWALDMPEPQCQT